MLNENNLISTLEQSMHQFRSAQGRLGERLKKVKFEIAELEDEAAGLSEEINALESSAKQTEQAIKSLLITMKS